MDQKQADAVSAKCRERNRQRIPSTKDSLLNKVEDLIPQFACADIENNDSAASDNVNQPENSEESQQPPRRPATNTSNQDNTSELVLLPSVGNATNTQVTGNDQRGPPGTVIPQESVLLPSIGNANTTQVTGNNKRAPPGTVITQSDGFDALPAPVCHQSGSGPQPGGESISTLSDLVLYDLSDKLSRQPQQLRKLALELGLKEEKISQIIYRHDKEIILQYYNILLTCRQDESKSPEDLIAALKKVGQKTAADWLIERTGSRPAKGVREEREASLEGDSSKSVVFPAASEASPGSCGGGGRGEPTEDSQPSHFYDIFFVFSEETKKNERASIDKLRDIFRRRQEWEVFEHGRHGSIGNPKLNSIENILTLSTHLVLLYSAADKKYIEHTETNMIIEMAFQKAFNDRSLKGKIIPVSSCREVDLPLSLQALTGAYVGDEYFESKLARSIDLNVRKKREECNK